MAWLLRELADPRYVAMFQKWCGVELVEDTESQETSRIPTVSCSRTPEDSCGHTGDYNSDHRDNTTSCCCRHHHLSPEEEARQRRASPTNYDNNNCMCKNVATSVTVCNGHCASAALSSTNGHFQNYPCTHLNKLSKGAPVSSAYERSTVCENKLTTNGYCTSISSDSVTPNSGNDASNALKTGDKHIFQDSNGNARGGHYARELTTSTTTARPASKIPTRISIRYPLVHAWARLGAVLGNEEFYLSVFPFLLWSVDSLVIRQTAMLWCLVMYLGQATKDYLRWPRPPSPPVIRLETQHLQEFSMPSTHAMAGTAIPLLLSRLLLERYELPVLPVLALGLCWCATTTLSRLYLGVHTLLDLVCGIVYALGIYAGFSTLMSRYDHYQQTHTLAPLVLMATSLALCTICYPSSDKNSAKGDAVQITSVLVGVGVGAWINYQLGLSTEVPLSSLIPVSLPSFRWIIISLLQFVLGVALIFVLKIIVKYVSVHCFSIYFGLDRVDPQHPGVMVGYKYTTYMTLGLAISFLIPLIYKLIGIGRPGYYLEVV